MTDLLDLPNWRLLGVSRADGEVEMEAEYTLLPDACTKCGVVGRLYKHGTKDTTIRDSPMRGYPARILAHVQRFRCRDCGETFLQPLGGVQEAMRMTERCAEYIKAQCLRDTFTRIAEHVGCDEKTVRTLAGEYISGVAGAYQPQLPRQLGIDENTIDGGRRCVLTDIGRRRPIDFLADNHKATVIRWLSQFPKPERDRVEVVSIDMWRQYLDAVNIVLPGVPVVVDKFHLVRLANDGIDKVRIRMGKSQQKGVRRGWMRSKALLRMRYAKLSEEQRFNLDMWLDNEPDVAAAYRAKEALFDLYDLPKEDGIAAFDAWPAMIPNHLRADFRKVLSACKNWKPHIISYFDHPITNAYTEAVNGVAKVINRQGHGYTWQVLRARVLFAKGATAMKQTPKDRCTSCGGLFTKSELEHGHLVPMFKGGKASDLVLVCRPCNRRFHTKHHATSSPVPTR